MPTPSTAHRWRAALRIEAALQRDQARSHPPLAASEHDWERLRRSLSHWSLMHQREWHVAADQCRRDVEMRISLLIDQLQRDRQALAATAHAPITFSVREIYTDLEALEAEFDVVTLNLREQTVSVETGPIVLEGIHLGRFEICLRWNRLGTSIPYDVNALDPNAAAADSGTTHPHVKDQGLCEGEGRTPILQALRQGRLFEFFLLVRQILNTYNPDSAYIPLDRWSGRECRDCGDHPADELVRCDRCEADLCLDCATTCAECSRECCSDCRERCPECESLICSACATNCDECDAPRCHDCLTDGRCDACHDPEPEEESHAETPLPPETALPGEQAADPVHTDRLGETTLPA